MKIFKDILFSCIRVIDVIQRGKKIQLTGDMYFGMDLIFSRKRFKIYIIIKIKRYLIWKMRLLDLLIISIIIIIIINVI